MRFVRCVVLVAVVMATAAEDQHKKELKEHYDHLAYIAEFDCHRPLPRVIPVHKLFSEEETANKAFFPDVTVLHRCDNSVGCCPSDHICRAKHTETLHLPFKVTFLEERDKHKKGSWIMEYHKIDNHTECACEEPPVVHETEECVQLRQSCDALFASCSKLQTSCSSLLWSPKVIPTTPYANLVEETTLCNEN